MTERHDIFEENAGPYVLGALTEIEIARFEKHLAECPLCREDVERLRPAAEALPRSVEQLPAPPSLKPSLMAVVEEDLAASAPPKRAWRLAGLRRWFASAFAGIGEMRPAVAWMGACFVLAVGIVAGSAVTNLSMGDDGPRTLAAKVDKQRVPFGSGSLMVPDRIEEGAILRVHGMPTLGSDVVYQVWVKRGDETISQSLFEVGQDGNGAAAVAKDLDGADAVLVTREPAGGARAPSEKPVLEVSL